MSGDTFACCHAPTLSLLLFEATSCPKEQKGLLLGTITKHTVTTITDDNEAKEEEKTVIYIEHCVAVDSLTFATGYIDINSATLAQYTRSNTQKVIGWYSFNRNVRQPRELSSKELLIHRRLCELFAHEHPHLFPVALLNASLPDPATHSFCYSLLTLKHTGFFQPLKLKIYTLSDRPVNSNEYITHASTFPQARTFEDCIANKIREESNPLTSVRSINHGVNERLTQMCTQILDYEKQRETLEQEIKDLRSRLQPNFVPGVEEVKRFTPPLLTDQTIRYNSDDWGRHPDLNPLNSNCASNSSTDDEQNEEKNEEEEEKNDNDTSLQYGENGQIENQPISTTETRSSRYWVHCCMMHHTCCW